MNQHINPVGMGWEWEYKFHSHGNPVKISVSQDWCLIFTSPSVSVALRQIGAMHLKLTAAMRPYSSLNQ